MVHPITEANESSPYGSLTKDEFLSRHSVSHSTEYITNSRGLKIFTQWWIPLPPKKLIGVIAFVHGFMGESGWIFELNSVFFARAGFAVCAIDHQGHGSSEGLRHHIPDINYVVDDCILFFDSFRATRGPHLPAFLYGESLGGAISLYITLLQKGAWDGLILNGAMCGISPKFKPPWPLEHLLDIVAKAVPTWRVIPTRGNVREIVFKEAWKRKLVVANPRTALERPRAATAREFIRVCRELQGRFEEVEVPVLIVHGGDDRVTDPKCSEELYRRAASKDKTIKIYPGMRHQMVGESDEDVELVFGDMLEWLKRRALPA